MSQSVTVISGSSGQHLTGLVAIPLNTQASTASTLQTLLGLGSNGGGYSDSINSGSLFLANVDVASVTSAGYNMPNNTSTVPGVLEISNVQPNGLVDTISTQIKTSEPFGYNTLLIEAPGQITITGNGNDSTLAVLGANSQVLYKTNGGSGTVVAGGASQTVVLGGSSWSVEGSSVGDDTINNNAGSATISTYGSGNATNNASVTTFQGNQASNVVGIFGGNATVFSNGTNDLVESFNGSNGVVSVSNSANLLVGGGSMTVYAAPTSTFVKAFFQVGGNLDFINQSSNFAEVTGDAPNATGGSATIFGGAGGGYYVGGSGGNNSLVGGSGVVTLSGSGSSNFLEANGSGSTSAFGANTQNILYSGAGNATMIATANTSVNSFYVNSGAVASVSSAGVGAQYFNLTNNGGSDTITGSTAATATNTYYLAESNLVDGGNTDVLTNFQIGTDHLYINGLNNNPAATIAAVGAAAAGSSGTVISLSDGTTIKLLNQTYNSSFSSYIGKSSI